MPIFKITNGAVLFSSSSVLPFSKREEEQEEGMRGKSCNKEILALLQLLPIQSSQVTVSQSSHSVKIHQTCTHNIYVAQVFRGKGNLCELPPHTLPDTHDNTCACVHVCMCACVRPVYDCACVHVCMCACVRPVCDCACSTIRAYE